MANEQVMKIKVEDAMQRLADVCVKLTREIAQLNAKVALLTTLRDSDHAAIEVLQAQILVLQGQIRHGGTIQ
jgi:hypothetical protein